MEPPHAMLLAAGLGTRLGELSSQRPKPLLPVANHPLLHWTAALCVHHGLRDLVVNLHHKGELVRESLGDGRALGAGSVTYSPEPEILGTGGGIKAMAALMPRRTCVALNAKVVVDLDLRAVLAFHRRQRAAATMVLRPDENAERWGAIGVDARGQVTRILDWRRPGAADGEAMMFTGIQVLEPELIRRIPDGPCCIIRTAYRQAIEEGAPLCAFVHRGYFYDHSTPARYLRGNVNLLQGQARLPAAPGPLVGVDAGARVSPRATLVPPLLLGPGARVEPGARVGPDVVLGTGSRVAAGAAISHSVVWEAATVAADTRHAVVTPEGTVAVPEQDDPARMPR
jgi:NDP-sugar pyrophosphorylase family protein